MLNALLRCSKKGQGYGKGGGKQQLDCRAGDHMAALLHPAGARKKSTHQELWHDIRSWYFGEEKKSCTAPSPVMFSLCSLGIARETCCK